mgnify:CR=1 FL=1
MLIGILQSGHFAQREGAPLRDYSVLYTEMLKGHGFQFKTWSVVDMEFPSSPKDADGWLVSGSKHGVYDDLPFIEPLEQFIRDIYAADVPLVGICFGHQIMAQALGGHVEKFKNGWAVGREDYAFDDGKTLAMNAWHQDQVITPPPDATTTATTDFCKHAALAYKGRAMSVQPHPEFESSDVEMLLELRAPGVVPPPLIDQSRETLNAPLDNDEMASRIAAFFKGSHHG